MKRYNVRFYQDDMYEVLEYHGRMEEGLPLTSDYYDAINWVSVYQGRLSDCETYIRLHEGGYM